MNAKKGNTNTTQAGKTSIPANERRTVAAFRKNMKKEGTDLTDEQAYRLLLDGQEEVASKAAGRPMTTVTILSRNDMFDAAHLKLGTAQAIVDAMAMLNVGGNMDTLNKGSLTACLMHADKLLDEARQMFMDAHTAKAREAA